MVQKIPTEGPFLFKPSMFLTEGHPDLPREAIGGPIASPGEGGRTSIFVNTYYTII